MKELFSRLSYTVKLLIGVWLVFFILVGFKINGSSMPYLAQLWNLDKSVDGYVFAPLLSLAQKFAGNDSGALREYAMAVPRQLRSDDYLTLFASSLAQLEHNPPFPVVNTNFANGQNMFVFYTAVPIWHVSTIARPASWGYFLFGKERGLAWQWWFSTFSCFTALFLLLKIVLQGHPKLAAFGAFWFCSSAYVVVWSLYPAHFVFFPALGCVAAYRLICSPNHKAKLLYGILLGWCASGFAMRIYPSLQLPIFYACLAVFAGLFWRERLYKQILNDRWNLLALLLAFTIAGIILIPVIQSSHETFQILSNTVYPGKRWGLGGGSVFADIFKGMYNLITINSATVPAQLFNQCEAASFYYLFPGVIAAVIISKRYFKGLGATGWFLLACVLFMIIYQVFGLPRPLARLTLMTRATEQRADIGVGLASIILCMLVHVRAKTWLATADLKDGERKIPAVAATLSGIFFLVYGFIYNQTNEWQLIPSVLLTVALLAALIIFWMLNGQSREFCLTLGGLVILTSAFFNPLSYGLSYIYESEMATQIKRFDLASGGKTMWIAYGENYPGTMIRMMGAKSLTGHNYLPQLEIWRKFDPAGEYEAIYNRVGHVRLEYNPNPDQVIFESDFPDALLVKVSPRHKAFKELGGRYVLVTGQQQQLADKDNLKPVYKSPRGNFSIYELE